jgi:hypothetical protein
MDAPIEPHHRSGTVLGKAELPDGDRGNVGTIRSRVHASILPDQADNGYGVTAMSMLAALGITDVC